MARSASHLLEIDERFCQCPICLQQYKEPKQLPCLHRYCRECLDELIERNSVVGTITCPECRAEFEVPAEGLNGLKTDFYIKNIIEYIQLQKSLEDGQLRECCDCLKTVKVTAYCFKCNDFLCKECHSSHMTKKILRDHKQHTLSLEEINSKNMTLEKLIALKETPRCQRHSENLSQLCCRTCSNLPICMTCIYGSHENHKIKDVNILATEEKEKLGKELRKLNQCKERVDKISETVDKVNRNLINNIKEKKERYQTRYERNISELKIEMKNITDNKRIQETELKAKQSRLLIETRKQMEIELEEVRQNFDSTCEAIRKEYDDKVRSLELSSDKQLKEDKEKLRVLENELQTLNNSMDERQKELEKHLEDIALQVHGVTKRYENITATARCILDAGNDWTAVHCIPDVVLACETLIVEMKREFPKLETFAQIDMVAKITKSAVSPIEIKGTETNNFSISNIKNSSDGNLVISGDTSVPCLSHITLINMAGNVLHHKKLKSSCLCPFRVCAYLTQFRLVTVCWEDEIGMYDVRDGSYITKNISDLISSRSACNCIKLVAADTANNNFLVVRDNMTDVLVFDNKMQYLYTMTLPDRIEIPNDMAVSTNGDLLVCDSKGGRAYAVNKEERVAKLLHDFRKPIVDGYSATPKSVCTDKKGIVYMLWTGMLSRESACRLVQYSQDGRQILTSIPLDNDASCITIVESAQREKLTVATRNSRIFYIFDL
ncbi:E3 ubiquitin-protein ligase TRIM56 [Holothuria leucospilota]|uniref:E3 ubiquitin-protein ligase TRIM56 n=1 Tax=Holothuria leucospilota TaxID=206669 RepID=A0A9Q1BT53_HOLLE|nr:E3 ubiquitin-protein ligase TRIM56 [Holothuria leucospilota]